VRNASLQETFDVRVARSFSYSQEPGLLSDLDVLDKDFELDLLKEYVELTVEIFRRFQRGLMDTPLVSKQIKKDSAVKFRLFASSLNHRLRMSRLILLVKMSVV
jgi:hypothetical protein